MGGVGVSGNDISFSADGDGYHDRQNGTSSSKSPNPPLEEGGGVCDDELTLDRAATPPAGADRSRE